MDDVVITNEDSIPRWGLVGTLLWTVGIVVSFIVVQIFTMGLYIGARYGNVAPSDVENLINELQNNGSFFSLCTIATSVICSGLLFFVVILKKGSKISDSLAFKKIDLKEIFTWFLVMVVFMIMTEILTVMLDRELVPEYMLSTYTSTERIWMLWLAIILAAPFFEEIFFRGFLISGLSPTIIGPVGSVVIASALWAVIHVQYGFYEISIIFLMGLVLGMARIKTGSVFMPIIMHSFNNFIATIETMFFVSV